MGIVNNISASRIWLIPPHFRTGSPSVEWGHHRETVQAPSSDAVAGGLGYFSHSPTYRVNKGKDANIRIEKKRVFRQSDNMKTGSHDEYEDSRSV